MSYAPIVINRKILTIMDVPFPDLETLESTAEALGSNCLGKMTFAEMATAAREKSYAQ
jgi:hypothetical protein